jgi:hypothetical protein
VGLPIGAVEFAIVFGIARATLLARKWSSNRQL